MTAALAAFRRPGGGGGGGGGTLTALATGGSWALNAEIGIFFAQTHCGVTGGLAPYNYGWQPITGDASPISNTADTTFSSLTGATATVRCDITDANGAQCSSNVLTISL